VEYYHSRSEYYWFVGRRFRWTTTIAIAIATLRPPRHGETQEEKSVDSPLRGQIDEVNLGSVSE
jgi:hypothetical protein